MINVEVHPDWYYPVDGMRTLILGTYPPHESRWSYPFYYPNRVNNFWPVMAAIQGLSLTSFEGERAVLERKKLMENVRVGVQNLGLRIERKGRGASDNDIRITEYQSILSIINSNTSLERILLTGYSGKTSTYKDFIKYLKQNNIKYSKPEEVKAGFEFILETERPIVCLIGNSTSPSARRKGVTVDILKEQFKKAIFG